ncbi:MAG: class I SAM-dependent methyltransferase [Desulfobulbaceae bacterium]|nr:class I SAM-dependent methyltransferase [Desulfobulbaceae bacterium]
MNRVILQKGRERSLLRRHPWIFSGAVNHLQGTPQPGETVEVIAADGRFLGRGAYSPVSQIRIRIWSFDEQEEIDEAFFQRRLQSAMARREELQIPSQTNAFRLVSAEADGLPGLIVDRYGDFLVCQFLSVGVAHWQEVIIEQLQTLPGVRGIYERSDVEVRKKEGLQPCRGPLWGEEPPELIEIEEHGLKFLVDVKQGHKTGFYLDQRVNRQLVRSYSSGAEVLNCFAYTGGFGLAALQGGASQVTNVEDVAGLLALIDKNVQLNEFAGQRCTNLKADVFQLLRQYAEAGRFFDLIILDPPKFAEARSQLMRASRGYKDINRLALKLLRPGGLLFTFSCSGLMNVELFQKIVADGAIDAGCDVQMLQWLGQSPDHPVKLHIPESMYLKGLIGKKLA